MPAPTLKTPPRSRTGREISEEGGCHQTRTPPSSATVEAALLARGRRATYDVIGRGRDALMFPGGPGFAAAYMRGDADLFADVLRSHLIDPHGSGGSTPPADPVEYSPEGHARFYEEVRRALGLGPVAVFGHSFGATTALTYAAMYPDSVTACIAVAAFGIGIDQDEAEGGEAAAETDAMFARHQDQPWFGEAKRVWDAWTERVLATDDPHEVESMMTTVLPLYTAHPERPEVWAGLQAFGAHLQADLAADKAWEGGLFQGIDLRPILGSVRAPTLLVAGELDIICGPAQAEPILDGLPNGELALIPDCGHMPVLESPDIYRAAVTRWLGQAL
jgi:proline iminopeptidase